MKTAALHSPGGPEALQPETIPVPVPQPGEVLIRVKAFGLNRSELFTRLGYSPDVPLPRVLGIEAVGVVEKSPSKEFREGETVATVMGGMGRQFDGSYAEYTCVPEKQVRTVRTKLSWERKGRGCAPQHTKGTRQFFVRGALIPRLFCASSSIEARGDT